MGHFTLFPSRAWPTATVLAAALLAGDGDARLAQAQLSLPLVVDTNLAVRMVINGLDQPVAMAFLGPNDFLVLEKASGKVKRVVNGVVTATALQLPVNSFSRTPSSQMKLKRN